MSTKPKGNRFLTNFMVKGVDYSKMHGTEAEGEAWEMETRAALKLGKPLPDAPKSVGGSNASTLGGVLRSAELLHWKQLRKGGRTQVLNANTFVDWAGANSNPREVFTGPRVRKFLQYLIEKRNCAPPTLNRYISAVSVLMKHADVPKIDLPWYKPSFERARKKFFSPAQEQEVIALLHKWGRERERDFFIFLNDTGLRPWEEGTKITWDQIRGGMIHDIVGKSGRLRDVPLTSRATNVLTRQDRSLAGPWAGLNPHTMAGLWQTVRAAIPTLDGTVWYTCRHTFASRMIQANHSYGNVAKLMDNSVNMIQHVYGHLASDDLQDAVASLEKYGQKTNLSVVNGGLSE